MKDNRSFMDSIYYADLKKKIKKETKKEKVDFQAPQTLKTDNKSVTSSLHYADMMQNAKEDNKVRRFMYAAIPILIIEIALVIGMVVFLIALPKNYCRITTNNKEAVIYVNNKKTQKFRFTKPDFDSEIYYFGVDVCLELPEGENYIIKYNLTGDTCMAFAETEALNDGKTYSMQVQGGVKTKLLSGITVKSDNFIEKFNVKMDVIIEKI